MNFANGHISFWIPDMVWLNARWWWWFHQSRMLVWFDAKEAPFYLMRPNHFVIWGFAVFFSWIKHFFVQNFKLFRHIFLLFLFMGSETKSAAPEKKDFFPSSWQHMCHSFEFISGREILEIRRKNVIIKFCLFRFVFNWGSHFFRFKRHNLFGGSFDDSVRLCRVWTAHDYISSIH